MKGRQSPIAAVIVKISVQLLNNKNKAIYGEFFVKLKNFSQERQFKMSTEEKNENVEKESRRKRKNRETDFIVDGNENVQKCEFPRRSQRKRRKIDYNLESGDELNNNADDKKQDAILLRCSVASTSKQNHKNCIYDH